MLRKGAAAAAGTGKIHGENTEVFNLTPNNQQTTQSEFPQTGRQQHTRELRSGRETSHSTPAYT